MLEKEIREAVSFLIVCAATLMLNLLTIPVYASEFDTIGLGHDYLTTKKVRGSAYRDCIVECNDNPSCCVRTSIRLKHLTNDGIKLDPDKKVASRSIGGACRSFADRAVEQYSTSQSNKCTHFGRNWHDNHQRYYRWCKNASRQERRNFLDRRERKLTRCFTDQRRDQYDDGYDTLTTRSGAISTRKPQGIVCMAHRARSPNKGWSKTGWQCSMRGKESPWISLGDDTGWLSQQIQLRSNIGQVCIQHRRRSPNKGWVDSGWKCSRQGKSTGWITRGDDSGWKDQQLRIKTSHRRIKACLRFSHKSPRSGVAQGHWICSKGGKPSDWVGLGDDTGWKDQRLKVRVRITNVTQDYAGDELPEVNVPRTRRTDPGSINADICMAHRARSPNKGWSKTGWQCSVRGKESPWISLGDDTGWLSQQIRLHSNVGQICIQLRRRSPNKGWADSGWKCSRQGKSTGWITRGDDSGWKDQQLRIKTSRRWIKACLRFSHRSPRSGVAQSRWICSKGRKPSDWVGLGDDTGWKDQRLKVRVQYD